MPEILKGKIRQVGKEIARACDEIEKALAKPNASPEDIVALQGKMAQLYARYSALVQEREIALLLNKHSGPALD